MIPGKVHPHIRLVASQKQSDAPRKKSVLKAQQLSFPYPERAAILLVDADKIDRAAFLDLVKHVTPGWIIDVRAVPRLDTLAGSRANAFELFRQSNAEYVDLFGRLGIKSYDEADANPVFWSTAVTNILEQSPQRGPYLFLFDNVALILASGRILENALKPIAGKEPKISVITSWPLSLSAPTNTRSS